MSWVRLCLIGLTILGASVFLGLVTAEILRKSPRPSISQRQADCVEAGGAPVVIGYGHGNYRVVCFRPDAVLWTDSEFQPKEPDHD